MFLYYLFNCFVFIESKFRSNLNKNTEISKGYTNFYSGTLYRVKDRNKGRLRLFVFLISKLSLKPVTLMSPRLSVNVKKQPTVIKKGKCGFPL